MTSEKLYLKKLKLEYKEYYKNYSLLVTLGLVWLGAAYVGTFDIQLSILILLIGITLFRPVLYFTTKLLGAAKIYKDESMKLLSKMIVLGILFGLIAGFFPFLENINMFFPAFSVVFGLIFLSIAASTGLRMYGFIGLILMAGGSYLGYYFPEDFSRAGYFSGFIMAGFGIINGMFGKKVSITASFLKQKLRAKLKAGEFLLKEPVVFNQPKLLGKDHKEKLHTVLTSRKKLKFKNTATGI